MKNAIIFTLLILASCGAYAIDDNRGEMLPSGEIYCPATGAVVSSVNDLGKRHYRHRKCKNGRRRRPRNGCGCRHQNECCYDNVCGNRNGNCCTE